MSRANAQHLAGLIRAFVARKLMPEMIEMEDGTRVSLLDWLGSLRDDRSQFDGHEAQLIGVAISPAQLNEVALMFRARQTESTGTAVRGSSAMLAHVDKVMAITPH